MARAFLSPLFGRSSPPGCEKHASVQKKRRLPCSNRADIISGDVSISHVCISVWGAAPETAIQPLHISLHLFIYRILSRTLTSLAMILNQAISEFPCSGCLPPRLLGDSMCGNEATRYLPGICSASQHSFHFVSVVVIQYSDLFCHNAGPGSPILGILGLHEYAGTVIGFHSIMFGSDCL